METLWPRIERLLPEVTKPARYIGGEQGAAVPRARPGPGGLAAALPRHLRDRPAQPGAADPLRDPQRARPTPWPSAPTPRGSTWRPPCGRPGCRSSASSSTCPAAAFDVLAFNLSAELVYTNVVNLHRPGRGAGPRGRPRRRRSARGGRRPLRLQPRAAGRLRRLLRPRRRRGGRRRDQRGDGGLAGGRPGRSDRDREDAAARAGRHRGRLRAGALRRPTYDGRPPGGDRARCDPRVPGRGRASGRSRDLADWPYPRGRWCR